MSDGVVRACGGEYVFVHFDGDPDEKESLMAWALLRPETTDEPREN